MSNSYMVKKLNEVIKSLNERELSEVIDFAEYLKEKKKKELLKRFDEWEKTLDLEEIDIDEEKMLEQLHEDEKDYVTLEETKRILGIEDNEV
ncbi:ribosomal protein L22 [Caldanaerobacter subterraneus subsp. tengcongensis MB4]|uniref:DUF2281 domain-containing protein n=3 Tax=Caldanaerobacter subterraneus TaxID=911092 RepID=Q8R717_CALS4|nr:MULTISPECIES: hypothetical protein [Caldanaerobacter]AAM25732.1 hypothetical protein TTE2612 [Caldanaerobacter subterraneus subsp. tengcongensis MB4]ERM93104.1 hypothetical protein O163_02155 [Caldanaerobacter subterraneus subsp. yonseiensis KB-1]MBE3578737.1 hypothetical protein [Caldanaerobacter subterraneus]MCS3917384.1 ribosomal protein L22 [Caldanaerobacter subterraneus subsp. tengcongensis MB4]